MYAAPTLCNALDLDIRLLPFDVFKKRVKTHLYLKYSVNYFLLFLYYWYDISVSIMCIYCDYCVYHYKSTELDIISRLPVNIDHWQHNNIIVQLQNSLIYKQKYDYLPP